MSHPAWWICMYTYSRGQGQHTQGRSACVPMTTAFDPAAKAKFWKDAKVPELLRTLADSLAALTEWNHDACDHAARKVAEEAGVKAGLLINATRVAIVGQAVAPPLFDTMVVLGQERVVRRLRESLEERK